MKISLLNTTMFAALTMFSINTIAADSAPYNFKNSKGKRLFSAALKQVKLTSPDGSNILAEGQYGTSKARGFNDYLTDDFKVPSGKVYMQITHEGNSSSRTEFRHLTEFSSDDTNIMKGTIRVASTTNGLDEVTVLQVHTDSGIGAPLMRIAQIVEDGTKFYEAKLRLSSCVKNSSGCDPTYDTYRWLDSSDNATVNPSANKSFYVRVKDGIVKMLMGGKRGTLMCQSSSHYSASNCSGNDNNNTTDSGDHIIADGWPTDDFYFKSGAYIQDAGTAVIQYKALKFQVIAQ